MVLKEADDRSGDIVHLKALLLEPNLSAFQKGGIKDELWKLEKGAWGEKDAAYFLDFHFKPYPNTVLLHDLRFELSNGKCAQIDHLIINRLLEIYVLETKNWDRLTVDEFGDCTTGGSKTTGTESPLEQCKRHVEVLKRVFEVDPELKRLAPRFEMRPRVLLAPKCHLKAPHHREWYFKADAFHAAWCKDVDDDTLNLKNVIAVTRFSKAETIIKIAERLIALDEKGPVDWRAKFGLPDHVTAVSANKIVASIPGLADDVPRWGDDWFVLHRKPTEEMKKLIRSAGYRAKEENGEWVWRLKR
jgi:hypothetical protein